MLIDLYIKSLYSPIASKILDSMDIPTTINAWYKKAELVEENYL